MRLLITTDTVGGVWTFTQELATGLLELDCSVLLVSFGRMPSASQQKQCDELCRRFGRRFRYVPSDVALEWMDANECAFESGAAVLEREVEGFAPDLIHSNQFCYGALDVDVPRVITAHSDVLSWAKSCRNEPLPDTQWLRNYVSQVQEGLSAANAVVAPTRWMLEALEQSFALPDDRSVIANGRTIPVSFTRPRALCAVTAGRMWDEAKGIPTLASVNSPIPILVAGEAHFDSAQQTVSVGQAQLLGQLNQLEMLELFRSSMIYLCLSLYEPFGLAALEAARCGCAVIARDIPSLMEVWEDSALYFNTAESLSVLLQRLASDPELLERARRRSCQRSQTFSRERMVERYLRIFQQVLEESTRAEHVA